MKKISLHLTHALNIFKVQVPLVIIHSKKLVTIKNNYDFISTYLPTNLNF